MTAESMPGCRSVVLHEDDVAMTHGANSAFAELFVCGSCSAGSVMVPCPPVPRGCGSGCDESPTRCGRAPDTNQRETALSLATTHSPTAFGGDHGRVRLSLGQCTSVRRSAPPEAVENRIASSNRYRSPSRFEFSCLSLQCIWRF